MWLWILLTLALGAFLSFIIAHVIEAPTKTRQDLTAYTQPGSRLVFVARLAWSAVAVWLVQRQRPPRLNNYRIGSRDPRYCGTLPTPEEDALEAPVSLTTDRHEDNIALWGVDASGRTVYVSVTRLAHGRAAFMLLIRDQLGQLYTLPNQPDSGLQQYSGGGWRGPGVVVECVQAMRTWRVKFSGYLRKGCRSEYNTEPCPADEDGVVEASVDMVWRSLKAPVDLFRDSSPLLLAAALAREGDCDIKYFTSLDRDAYDQLGVLAGTVQLGTVAEPDPPLWYLRGSRLRRWGMGEAATKLHRSVTLLSMLHNGDFLFLTTFCYPASLTHCSFGYLQTAAGDYLPISSTNFNMADVAEDGILPSHLFFRCTAGGRRVEVCIALAGDSARYYTGDPWTLQHDLCPTNAYVGSHAGAGVAVFTRSYSDLCPVPESDAVDWPLSGRPDTDEGEDDPLVVELSDGRCGDVALSGGKGASLALLSALQQRLCPEKFLVPEGITVTTNAWVLQLDSSPSVTAAIQGLERAVGSGQDRQIKDACDKAWETLRQIEVCTAVREAVRGALLDLYDTCQPAVKFAVRSSACDEDGSEASAAGQNLTVLGCAGLDQLLDALAQCWASVFTFSSVQYRRQRGIAPVGEMAVVIQEMVAADLAGVVFTRDPATGSPASVTITANYGLGESVVSGSSEPDTVVVRRSWRGVLSLASATTGDKATRHVMCASGGTKEESVPDSDRRRCCVSEALALRLARLALHIERAFSSPRDIEFAVVNDEIYLLQARPITSLESWSDLELQLELDDAILSDQELLTCANTGEVLPGALTPLTLSLVPRVLDMAVRGVVAQHNTGRGCGVDPAGGQCIVSSHLHCMLNMMEILYRNLDLEISTVVQSLDLAVFGHLVTSKEFHRRGLERYGAVSTFAKIYMSVFSLWEYLYNKWRVPALQEQTRNYTIKTGRDVKAHVLFTKIASRVSELIHISDTHARSSGASSFTQLLALVMLTENRKTVTTENLQDIAIMLASCCNGQDSTGVPAAMTFLTEEISKDEERDEFLGLPVEEGRVWLQSHPGRVGDIFQEFIELHGHRCIREFEFESISWGMDCRSLVGTLQSMVAQSSSITKPRDAIGVSETLSLLKTDVKPGTRRALSFVLPMCRDAVDKREATKSCLIKAIDAFRRAFRNLGDLLVAEGRIPTPELVFYLQFYELALLVRRSAPHLVTKAVRRKRMVARLEKLHFPEISEGRPVPLADASTRGQPAAAAGSVAVRGTPVCLGRAEGPARVVTSLAHAYEIQRGDILVTYSTDVGWTPYFPLLSGIVTEIGGLISHGAVVAREYGLPCVVGARAATEIIKSGDLIELDGNSGTITKVCERVS